MISDIKLKIKNMKRTILYLLFGFILTSGLTSCIKDQDTPVGDAGKTIVKINEGPRKDFYYSPFTTVKTESITVTRDVNSNASLNQPTEVVMVEDATLVPAGYTLAPTTLVTYTGSDAGVVVTSGKVTAVRFAAGEFAKKIKVNIAGSAWTNLSTKYAIAYKITDPGTGNQLSASLKQVVATFGIKNQWDGIYEVTEGTFTDVTNSAWTHVNNGLVPQYGIKQVYHLQTASATTCLVYDDTIYGSYYCVFYTGSAFSGFGNFQALIEFDPATNKVVAVTNNLGQQYSSSKRSGRLDPTGINEYDPATKTLKIKFNMLQEAGLTPALPAPYVRATWDETWSYTGPRN
jgi:hypothetical protein